MPILMNKALELIDEKIKQFQHILDTATYDTRYNTEYHEVYYGTENLVVELFSEEEEKKFRANVSIFIIPVASMHIDYDKKLRDYKNHINKCIAQLKVYKERIENFWEDPESIEPVVNKTTNPEVKQKADFLLVTATKTESRAIIDVFQDVTSHTAQLVRIGAQVYQDIGSVNETRIFMVQSEMGSGGVGASQQTVQKGIIDLSPNAVIMVGIAFGIDSEKLDIGDVLVSRQLMPYEFQRVENTDGNPKIISRGDKAHASTRLLNYFRNVDIHWDESKCKVSFGLILSGEKLVDNIDFRRQLCDLAPEAIGGEMEGAGMYVACHDSNVDWILVKSICDWADGNKSQNKENQQKLAAKNAASFVLYMLQQIPFTRKSTDYESHPDSIIEDDRSFGTGELAKKGEIAESNQKPMIGGLRKVTTEPQIHDIPKTFISPSTGIEFVLIPTGEFMMGSMDVLLGKPVHRVIIKDSFYMGIYPVTQKQWTAVMRSNPSKFKGDDLPVEHISWNDAQEFIKKLNEDESTEKYRLPSEAEWEYACRAGTQTKYCFGDDKLELGDYSWYCRNSGGRTHPVAQKEPNIWGLYDMHGNVLEWVQDTFHPNYIGAPSDGSAWEDSDSAVRIIRGGSYKSGDFGCQSADCDSASTEYKFSAGFRLLREL